MRALFLLFLAIGCLAGERQVFLLIGQSNMAGRAKIPAEFAGPMPGVALWNGKAWEPAKPPYNRYATQKKKIFTGLNPGPSFAKAWREANPDVEIGIVCAARGGTSIEQWQTESKMGLYKAAMKAIADALASGGQLAGVLWHQGESNSTRADAYPEALAELCERLRKDLGHPKLPIVFSQIGAWRDNYAAFNAMIVKQPVNIPNSSCITTEDLTNKDNAHFDTAGQIGLGKRYAAAMKGLVQP